VEPRTEYSNFAESHGPNPGVSTDYQWTGRSVIGHRAQDYGGRRIASGTKTSNWISCSIWRPKIGQPTFVKSFFPGPKFFKCWEISNQPSPGFGSLAKPGDLAMCSHFPNRILIITRYRRRPNLSDLAITNASIHPVLQFFRCPGAFCPQTLGFACPRLSNCKLYIFCENFTDHNPGIKELDPRDIEQYNFWPP